jgi:glutathione S-transferase
LEPKSYARAPSVAVFKKWKSEFIDAFEAIDGKLKKDNLPYLCGRTLTIADIIIFNELSQFLFLTNEDFK